MDDVIDIVDEMVSDLEDDLGRSLTEDEIDVLTDRIMDEVTENKIVDHVDKVYDRMGTEAQYYGVWTGESEALTDKPSKQQRKLLFLRAFDESLVQVVRYEWNIRNPRFGQPVMYRITLNDPRQMHSGIGLPLGTTFVHWTRVIHIADNLLSSEVFGMPRMQPVLNKVLDIRKVSGAGAEGYWQSCFAAISMETHPQLGGDPIIDKDAAKDALYEFRNRLRRDLVTSGMTAKTIPPSVIDPTPHITTKIEEICIKIPCPKRVFMGSERGELASSQDDSQWNDVLRGRQNLYITPRIIVPLVNRLIMFGVLPEPANGFFVEWPDLDSLGKKDKATVALTLVQALTAFLQGGEQGMTLKDFYVRLLGWTDEEAEAVVSAAEKQHEEKMEEHAALADEHGMVPEIPGFQQPPPEPKPFAKP